MEKGTDTLFYYAQYHSFCELLRDVHLLRDFTLQTYNILTLMIQQLKRHCHTYNTSRNNNPNESTGNALNEIMQSAESQAIDKRFRELCNKPLYSSYILSKLCTRTGMSHSSYMLFVLVLFYF